MGALFQSIRYQSRVSEQTHANLSRPLNARSTVGTWSVMLALLAATCWVPLALAADDLQVRQWADEAHQWERKGRDDLAADLWNKLLLLNPNNGEALVGLGLTEARAGNLTRARELFTRAQRVQPAPRGLDRLGFALNSPTSVAPIAARPAAVVVTERAIAPRTPNTPAPLLDNKAKSTRKAGAIRLPDELVAPADARPLATESTLQTFPIGLPVDLSGAARFQPDALPEPGRTMANGGQGGVSLGKPRPCTPYPLDPAS